MRLMGLDYGSKTVGVAVSDPLGLTAQGVETVWRKQENKLRQTMARIEELISEYQVERIVLGYPKNMNNTVRSASAVVSRSSHITTGRPVLFSSFSLNSRDFTARSPTVLFM